MDNTKKVVRQQADVSQGDELVQELNTIITDSMDAKDYIVPDVLLMKLNSHVHRRDNAMFNQGYQLAIKEMKNDAETN